MPADITAAVVTVIQAEKAVGAVMMDTAVVTARALT